MVILERLKWFVEIGKQKKKKEKKECPREARIKIHLPRPHDQIWAAEFRENVHLRPNHPGNECCSLKRHLLQTTQSRIRLKGGDNSHVDLINLMMVTEVSSYTVLSPVDGWPFLHCAAQGNEWIFSPRPLSWQEKRSISSIFLADKSISRLLHYQEGKGVSSSDTVCWSDINMGLR